MRVRGIQDPADSGRKAGRSPTQAKTDENPWARSSRAPRLRAVFMPTWPDSLMTSAAIPAWRSRASKAG